MLTKTNTGQELQDVYNSMSLPHLTHYPLSPLNSLPPPLLHPLPFSLSSVLLPFSCPFAILSLISSHSPPTACPCFPQLYSASPFSLLTARYTHRKYHHGELTPASSLTHSSTVLMLVKVKLVNTGRQSRTRTSGLTRGCAVTQTAHPMCQFQTMTRAQLTTSTVCHFLPLSAVFLSFSAASKKEI